MGPVEGVLDDSSDESENADLPLIPLTTDLPPLKPLNFAEAREMTLIPLLRPIAATLRLLL